MPVHARPKPGFRLSILAALITTSSLAAGGCGGPAPSVYPLEGQVLSVDQARQELTVKHGDIPKFMPAMTMAYKVRAADMEGRIPGELIKATLVVEGSSPYLRSIERTGMAPVPAGATSTRTMDVLTAGDAVRDGELKDETGRRRSLKDWRGQVLAVTFVYTRCPLPNFCPLVERHFAAAQEQVRAASDLRGRVRLLSVTLDPEYDTPEVLARHAAALKLDSHVWSMLTGGREQVEAFAAQFGVSAMREKTTPSELVHNLRTAIIAADGTLLTILSGADWDVSHLLAELRNARARG